MLAFASEDTLELMIPSLFANSDDVPNAFFKVSVSAALSFFSSISRVPSSLSVIPTAERTSEFSLTASFKRSEHIVLIELEVLPSVL